MEIQRQKRQDHLELIFEGRLDGYWAQHLSTSAAEVMREGTHAVRVNLSRATYISSAGIGTLVELYKNFTAVNGSFEVIEPSRQVRQILEMVGLGTMLLGGGAATVSPSAAAATERVEAGGAILEVHNLDAAAAMHCRTFGSPGRLPHAAFVEQDCRTVSLAESRLALGLGAFGENFAHCRERGGEFLAVSGAGAFQPTDGTNFPDFMVASGNFVPQLAALYGLCCDGRFGKLARFESASPGDPVSLSAIVSACLDLAGSDSAALVILSESAGLMGAALKRSPAVEKASLFSYPEVRTWLSFSPERCFAHNLVLIGGVASKAAPGELAPFVRPLARGQSVLGHFHAVAFGYRPLQKGALDLKSSIRGLFDAGGPEGVLHLLADDRESAGTAETELRRGACWIGAIKQFSHGEGSL